MKKGVVRSLAVGISVSLLIVGVQSAHASMASDIGGIVGGGIGAVLGGAVAGNFGAGAGGAAGVYAGQDLGPIVADHPALSANIVTNYLAAGAPELGSLLQNGISHFISWLF